LILTFTTKKLSFAHLKLIKDEDLKDTVVAFDLDDTLKYGSLKEFEPVTETQKLKIKKRKVRGGESTIEILKRLKQGGALLVVVTGRQPSALKYDACLQELVAHGLNEYFIDSSEQAKPKQFEVDEHVKAYGGNGIIVCEYYKPHSLLAYLNRLNRVPRFIYFIDDFVVNVLSFVDHIQLHANNQCLKNLKKLSGLWIDPKSLQDIGEMATSKTENSHDPSYAPYLEAFLKQASSSTSSSSTSTTETSSS